MPPTYFLAEETVYPDAPEGCPDSSSSSSSSSSGAQRPVVTSYAYVWYAGTGRVQQRTTTLPVISAAQNGSGVAAATKDYYDLYGNRTWHMDERGFLTNTSYDIPTGAVSERIDDVNTALVANAPPGWVTPPGGGLHLVSDFQFDSQGRITQVLGPTHTISLTGVATAIRRATWTVYQDGLFQTWTAQGYATGSGPNYTYTLVNPVSIAVTDKAGRSIASIQATRASTAGALQPTDSFPQSSYVRWKTMQYADGFDLSSQRVYKLIPTSGSGVSGTHYDEMDFGLDVMKRQNRIVTPGGTITRTVFDVRNNPMLVWLGTNDTGARDSDPSGGGAPGNNMVQVTANQYDNGLGGGDNNLTQVTQYVDASTMRVTTLLYDWRERRTDTDGEVDFYEQRCYDNLDRVIRTDRRDTTAAGNLVGRSTTAYDDRGWVYQTVRYAVDPTTGIVGNGLTDNTWYDASGNIFKSQPAGSQLFTKKAYDGIGRVTAQYTGYNLTDSSYANADSVATDTILEQVETAYDPASNVIQVTTRQRYHNATGVGPLGSPSSAQPQARVTYTATWQDGIGRVAATADYGTNGGTALSRPQTIPVPSDMVLVSRTTYDSTGSVVTTTDPMGTAICYFYDAAGREVQRILNCQTLSSSSSSSSSSQSSSSASSSSSGAITGPCPLSADTNVTYLTTWNADGNVASATVLNSTTGNQVTQYLYGSTLATSGIASSLLKVAEVYPDSVGGSDQVTRTYNRQSEVTTKADQNGTVHAYDYDLLSRPTEDSIMTLAPGVDGMVLRIETAYEVRGMVQSITQYDNATVGQGNVVNQVQFVYNPFAQLTADYQSHAGAVNTATTPACQYAYADGSANTIRLTAKTYPNGRVVNYNYGPSGGTNDALSRPGSLIDSDGVTHLADYLYLGLADVIQVNESQPGLAYTLVGISGGNDPVTGDIYRGLDLFGRVKDLIWTVGGTSSSSSSSSSSSGAANLADRVQYGYDRIGNRLWRKDLVAPGELYDELYANDGLYRLKDLQRGTLNLTETAISPLTFAQCWGLDVAGNWEDFRQDDTGSGVWDLVQNRAANAVNEITSIVPIAGPPWVSPGYDRAGNMTAMPQPGGPSQGFTATYDAWSRLVGLSAAGLTVAGYQYDGLMRRVVKHIYSGGVLSQTRHVFYSFDWQALEERVGTATIAERQFVWGIRWVDDLVLRDRDPTGGGVLNERFYGIQDANWNLTSVADASGFVQERYAYDAYGVPSVMTPGFGIRLGTLWDWESRYGGYRWDNESGLYHVRHRVYQSLTGCWSTRDPVVLLPDDCNLYRYVGNNPVSKIDAWGLGKQPLIVFPIYGIITRIVLPSPPLSSIEICQRDIMASNCCQECVNSCGGQHTYVQYGGVDQNGQPLPGTVGVGFAGTVSPERAFRPNRCFPCKKTTDVLRYGAGAGKQGIAATDNEIYDCITKTPPARKYHWYDYNCNSWAVGATLSCGLNCVGHGPRVYPIL
jgi:RHS repeat-associated protein